MEILMLTLGICDDVRIDRINIVDLIKAYCLKGDCEVHILTFESGEALAAYCLDGKPAFDIIYMDIYTGEKNGIEIAEILRFHGWDSKIIFTTSSTEHAFESFKVFPFNYLLKPISGEVFNSVFEKAIKAIDIEKQKTFSIKSGSNIQTLQYKDILFFESMERTLYIHTLQDKKISFYSKLDAIEMQIKDRRFIRCHKSFYVNMDFILSVENYSFHLTSGVIIPITQKNFSKVKKLFYKYILEKANLETDLKRVK